MPTFDLCQLRRILAQTFNMTGAFLSWIDEKREEEGLCLELSSYPLPSHPTCADGPTPCTHVISTTIFRVQVAELGTLLMGPESHEAGIFVQALRRTPPSPLLFLRLLLLLLLLLPDWPASGPLAGGWTSEPGVGFTSFRGRF